MNSTDHTENPQAKLWNGHAGHAWVSEQAVLDRMFKPFEDMLLESINGSAVLDIGCGTGSTTLAAARQLGGNGRCMGLDISEPMIAAAKRRAQAENSTAHFVCANAQAYPFAPASFDAIMSRFGVMFFDDSVRAFANLRSAAKDAAKLRFIAWRSAADNPFMTTAERAAAPFLPDMPPRQPDAPGQFAFADQDKVRGVLEQGGWLGIGIRAIDVECVLPEAALIAYFTQLGPLGLMLQKLDEPQRMQIITSVRAAFEPYVHGTEVRYTAACWLVDAQAGVA
jgi:SAM-dependent methyltransferase